MTAIIRRNVTLLTLSIGAAAALLYAWRGGAPEAAVALVAWFCLLLILDLRQTPDRMAWGRGLTSAAFALGAGVVPIIVVQYETRFSEEEFFAALQAIVLAAWWLLARVAVESGRRVRRSGAASRRYTNGVAPPTPTLHPHRRVLITSTLAALIILVGAATTTAYRRSFFTSSAPSFPGISPDAPFACAQESTPATTVNGQDIFRRLLDQVAANPSKSAPEHGMLALGLNDRTAAEAFRQALMKEANAGLFTEPAHSVKSSQYDGALRAYYYPRVRDAFPDLFSAAEQEQLQAWFAAINRRAWTVEWIDWLYALSFAQRPAGPYENQENGAGLLSVLEAGKLSAPELTKRNQDYLRRNRRGWNTRFRVTDDTPIYQHVWINNAYFQSLLDPDFDRDHQRQSFQWLMLQALPNGAAPRYNHPLTSSLAGVAYLGATLTGDMQLLWLADHALKAAEARGEPIYAQPGVERPVDRQANAPRSGSCLLYGDSGLPTQFGPLAPDKIVFRDGWTPQSAYILLNLRFTGWHRYKATNTLTLWYQGQALVSDDLEGAATGWLPLGRQAFRDKRIPREQLNGFTVQRTGLDAIVQTLTRIGSPWAQDLPPYATVEQWEPGASVDRSRTVIENWRGWRHQRAIHFYHGGPIAIIDTADGPPGHRSAIHWHAVANDQQNGNRIQLRASPNPAELLLIPLDDGELRLHSRPPSTAQPTLHLEYTAKSRLRLATLLLSGPWVGAEAQVTPTANGAILRIQRGTQEITIPLNEH